MDTTILIWLLANGQFVWQMPRGHSVVNEINYQGVSGSQIYLPVVHNNNNNNNTGRLLALIAPCYRKAVIRWEPAAYGEQGSD